MRFFFNFLKVDIIRIIWGESVRYIFFHFFFWLSRIWKLGTFVTFLELSRIVNNVLPWRKIQVQFWAPLYVTGSLSSIIPLSIRRGLVPAGELQHLISLAAFSNGWWRWMRFIRYFAKLRTPGREHNLKNQHVLLEKSIPMPLQNKHGRIVKVISWPTFNTNQISASVCFATVSVASVEELVKTTQGNRAHCWCCSAIGLPSRTPGGACTVGLTRRFGLGLLGEWEFRCYLFLDQPRVWWDLTKSKEQKQIKTLIYTIATVW